MNECKECKECTHGELFKKMRKQTTDLPANLGAQQGVCRHSRMREGAAGTSLARKQKDEEAGEGTGRQQRH